MESNTFSVRDMKLCIHNFVLTLTSPDRPPTRRSARVAAKSHYTLPCPESQPVPDSQPFLADGTLGCFALDRRHGGDTAGQVPVPGAQRHAPTTRPIKGFRVDMREMPSQVKGG